MSIACNDLAERSESGVCLLCLHGVLIGAAFTDHGPSRYTPAWYVGAEHTIKHCEHHCHGICILIVYCCNTVQLVSSRFQN